MISSKFKLLLASSIFLIFLETIILDNSKCIMVYSRRRLYSLPMKSCEAYLSRRKKPDGLWEWQHSFIRSTASATLFIYFLVNYSWHYEILSGRVANRVHVVKSDRINAYSDTHQKHRNPTGSTAAHLSCAKKSIKCEQKTHKCVLFGWINLDSLFGQWKKHLAKKIASLLFLTVCDMLETALCFGISGIP